MNRGLVKRNSPFGVIAPFADLFEILEQGFDTSRDTSIQKRFVSNIREEDGKYLVDIEAPGMDKKDINIEVKDGYLVVSGKREFKNEVKKEDYILMESSFGSFERSFKLPKDIDTEHIDAKIENGLVEIVIPKNEEKSSVKKIEIK